MTKISQEKNVVPQMHPTKKSKLAKQSLTNYKNERQHSRGDSFQMADFKKPENIIQVENVSQQDSSDSNDVPFQLEEWKQPKKTRNYT